MKHKLATILSVDDNPQNLFSLKVLVEEHLVANVIDAHSGEEALDILLQQEVDLIILDVNMPGMDGFETATIIKNRKKNEDTPIIFLTADYRALEFQEKGFKVGAVDYLTKPIDEHQLINKINIYLKLITMANELKRSNKELESFAHVISHDLKEPLRTVNGFIKLLIERYENTFDDEGQEFISYIRSGSVRMTSMIDDLLLYSSLKRQDKLLEEIHTDLLLDGVLHGLKGALEKSGGVVTYEGLPQIIMTKSLMIRLFQNLISNALKFQSDRPPKIHVSCRNENESWLFSVQDNGVGIDSRCKERIFNLFERAHNRDEYPGSGVGLAICRSIVTSMGGEIWVESTPGKGSTFFFTLPILQEADI